MQEIFKKFSLREFRLILTGLFAVLTCASAAAFVIPNAKSYRAAAAEVAVLQQASLDGTKLEMHLQAQREKIQALDYRLHGDMANMPVRQVESYIIGRLQRVSWDNNVELVSVEPSMGDRVEIFQEMIFNVRLSGAYEDLYDWLWDVRKDLGFVVVKEYALARLDNKDDEPLLSANLSLASYRAIE